MVTLQTWRERMSEDMRLRDFRPRTQEGYLAATRQFVDWTNKDPGDFAEEDVRRYFLYLRETKKLAPSSINIVVHALRFFLVHTLQRDWAILDLLRVNKPRTLPVVLSTRETRAVLGAVRHPVRRVALTTIYALGLRLNEGLALETGHIDADRLLVWVRDGKGGVDRGVPLPRPLLSCLRRYWKLERPACSTPHLFVAEGRESRLHETTLQKIARRALPGVPLPPIPWEKRWVVFAKPVAHGAEKVLEYLGRYVHRTAMSDRALLAMDDRSVTLRYRDSRDRRHKVLTLPADEMLRRFLQHVPPKGMHRVRAFGLLHPAQRQTLRRLQLLLAPRRPGDQEPASDPPPPRARTKCAHCGQPGLTLVLRFEPDWR